MMQFFSGSANFWARLIIEVPTVLENLKSNWIHFYPKKLLIQPSYVLRGFSTIHIKSLKITNFFFQR